MALADAILIFVVSLLVGTAAILAGVRLVVDADAGVANAAFTALVGALVWAVASYLVDLVSTVAEAETSGALEAGLPIAGAVLMLAAWIGVLNWRYPGGWWTALAIGVVAWVVAVAIVYGLSTVGIVAPEALGVPSA